MKFLFLDLDHTLIDWSKYNEQDVLSFKTNLLNRIDEIKSFSDRNNFTIFLTTSWGEFVNSDLSPKDNFEYDDIHLWILEQLKTLQSMGISHKKEEIIEFYCENNKNDFHLILDDITINVDVHNVFQASWIGDVILFGGRILKNFFQLEEMFNGIVMELNKLKT